MAGMIRAVTTLLIGLSLTLLVAGCGAPGGVPACAPNDSRACSTWGGAELGEFVQSWPLSVSMCESKCREPVEVARNILERRDADHPPLESIDEFAPDRRVLCGDQPCGHSGYLGIFVFTFTDASSLSVIVSCPGIAYCGPVESY